MSKELEYRLPLSYVVNDYEVKLQNCLEHPEIRERDKEVINKQWLQFDIARWGIVIGSLGWTYRIWKKEKLGVYPSKVREVFEVAKLVGLIIFGQLINFNRLQYNTEL